MKESGIYKILNIQTNDFYIGSSKDIMNRWKQHKHKLNAGKHTNIHLQNAWNKYGEDLFILQIIEVTSSDKNILLIKEQHYIDTFKPRYNICPTANSPMSGRRHTSEWKENMRIKNSGGNNPNFGRRWTSEQKEKMSKMKKGVGHNHTDETKRKLSDANKGKKLSEETKDKIKANHWTKLGITPAWQGKTHTDESKTKIAEARKNLSETARKNISDAQKGKTLADETKAKISESLRGRIRGPYKKRGN